MFPNQSKRNKKFYKEMGQTLSEEKESEQVKVVTKRKRVRPATRVIRPIVTAGGTQVKRKKWARVRVRTKK